MKPQTVEELAKELGYSQRNIRYIAQDMVDKGEWEETIVKKVKTVYVKAYIRKKK